MIKKPNLKIIKIFNAKDRLDELDEVPRLEFEEEKIEYWLASKLLCEKDGGRLPTMKELAEIASYVYQTNFEKYDNKCNLEIKNELIPLGDYWSSSEFTATNAYYRLFGSADSPCGRYGTRGYSSIRALCVCDQVTYFIERGVK